MYTVSLFAVFVYVLVMTGMFWWLDRKLYVKVIKGQLVANRTFTCGGKEIQKNTRGAVIPEGVKIPRSSLKYWIGERTKLVGECVIEEGVYIGSDCLIDNTTINKGSVVLGHSVIYNSNIANDCRVGYSSYIDKTKLQEKCMLGNNADVVECVLYDRVVTTKDVSLRSVVIYSGAHIESGAYIENSIIGERVVLCKKSCIVGCTLPENTVYCIEGGVFIRYGAVLTMHEFGHVYHMIQAVDGFYLVGTGIKEAIPMKEHNVPEYLRRVYRKFVEFMPQEC